MMQHLLTTDQKLRVDIIKPCEFKEGDIVEVAFGFKAIKIDNTYEMKPVLRSVVLLDKTETEVSTSIQILAHNSPFPFRLPTSGN